MWKGPPTGTRTPQDTSEPRDFDLPSIRAHRGDGRIYFSALWVMYYVVYGGGNQKKSTNCARPVPGWGWEVYAVCPTPPRQPLEHSHTHPAGAPPRLLGPNPLAPTPPTSALEGRGVPAWRSPRGCWLLSHTVTHHSHKSTPSPSHTPQATSAHPQHHTPLTGADQRHTPQHRRTTPRPHSPPQRIASTPPPPPPPPQPPTSRRLAASPQAAPQAAAALEEKKATA